MMEPPNLLFIYTDQQRADTLAAYGNDLIQMPNLNRLAEESVVIDQAYVAQPVCQPSRSTLLTGLYPHTTGCFTDSDFILHPLKSETPCLPELIEEGDYFCGPSREMASGGRCLYTARVSRLGQHRGPRTSPVLHRGKGHISALRLLRFPGGRGL